MLKPKILVLISHGVLKVFLICNLQFVICNFTFSQPVHQEWVARISGPFNDLNGPFLQVDKNGNSYVAGTHVINDSINILCVKYNTSGVQQWYKLYKYPGFGYFVPFGLAIDTSGNAYVISSYALDGWSSPLNGSIVKFNGFNGNIDWAKKYVGDYGQSTFEDIKIDRMNNIYVVGWSDSSHLVIRYNTNGDSVWVRKYHPPPIPWFTRREVCRACTIDDSLNIIFTGKRILYYNPPYSGELDSLLVAKYSSRGDLRWETVYSNNYLQENVGTKITFDQNGNLYIGGFTNGAFLTMKYDRNGVLQWAKIYNPPGSSDNEIYGIALDRLINALYVTGYSVINSSSTAVTIKYNISTGDSSWVKRGFGVSGSSSAWDVEVDSLGHAYITGSSIGDSSSVVSTIKYSPLGDTEWFITYNSPFNMGDGGRALRLDNLNKVYVMGESRSSSQTVDYIIIKYSQLMGIKKISNQLPYKFKLYQNYPNPFNPKTIINYKLPITNYVRLIIYDVLGKEITVLVNEKQNQGKYKIEFDGSNFASGVYFYRLEAGSFVNVKKMVLVK